MCSFVALKIYPIYSRIAINNLLHAIQFVRVPPISLLLFCGDSIVFCNANRKEDECVRSILKDDELASGQKINLAKFNVLFGKGVHPSKKNEVLLSLDILEVLSYDKCLGLPTRISKDQMKAFMQIKEHLCKQIRGWLGKNLS